MPYKFAPKWTVALGFVIAAAPALSPALAQDAPTADTVIATIGETEITLGHMIMARARLPQRLSSLPDEVLFEGILDQLVQQTLLAETVTTPDRVTVLSLDNEERTLKSNQVITDITENAMSEDAMRAAYEAQYGEFEGAAEFNASHILVTTEEEALALIEQLDGGADFAALAQEFSTGPSGENGGQLGWFGDGQMVAPFFEGVVALEIGEVSPPVQTQFGWHVIKLNDSRVSAAPAMEEVMQEVEAAVRRNAVDAYVAELRDKAELSIVDVSGFDPALISNFELIDVE
ncbi:MAG: peptidylprolyl isomerase [Pseudomonadota bacterium]